MKLAYAEMAGFRGFRDRVRVEFGAGFTIICGRNGVGKSTLFDCVEYALTGRIDKYDQDKAGKESLADYIWWRGAGEAPGYYVKVGFHDEEGGVFEVERSREQGAVTPEQHIAAMLLRENKPEDPLTQLCRTSIIRDEWIAALSVDLSETDRFDLVRSALGPAEGAELLSKSREVIRAVEARHATMETQYNELRAELALNLSQATELRDTIAKAGDLTAALQLIRAQLPAGTQDMLSQLQAVRTNLANRRRDLSAMYEAAVLGHRVLERRAELQSPEAEKARADAKRELSEAIASHEVAQGSLAAARATLAQQERENETASLLMGLVHDGHKLGLNDGHCPLCAAQQTDAEFEAGLALARARISELAAGMEGARRAVEAAEEAASGPAARLAMAKAVSDDFVRQSAILSEMEGEHINYYHQHGLDLKLAGDPTAMDKANEVERNNLLELESALRTLEASQGVSQLTTVEERTTRLRAESDEVTKALSRAQEALNAAKALEKSVRRVSGEIIDEQLAQISPLLNEIYQRLQPHADWRTIDYKIRGDVRRFLSLRVGDGLNPQFVFSSGQRRAAGLAFLLSVHLSRPWSKWNTLLLDDPVQHIDDFRALQLTEVLAAIRMDGRQIICAVEDTALADLMSRRLSGNGEGGGKRIDLDILSTGSAGISLDRHLPSIPVGVLRRELPKAVDA